MYQYSLIWFVGLFTSAIDNTEKVDDVPSRLKDLTKYFTYSLYVNICRSLFERDKLLFSLLLAINLKREEGEIEMTEWMFLLTGGVGLDNSLAKPADWIPNRSWDELCRLSDYENFKDIHKDVLEGHEGWKTFYDANQPQTADIPEPWNTKLNKFQKLLVLRCFRSDKLVPAVQDYVFCEFNLFFLFFFCHYFIFFKQLWVRNL